jgi:type III restriction enzyme
MSDRVIDNPILNSPYRTPERHFAFDRDGITDRVVEGRRPSSFFIPVPRPRKRARQPELPVFTQDDITLNRQVNEVRAAVDAWRKREWPDVTPVSRRLLEYWADEERDNKILFCQREAAETAIFLTEAAAKWQGGWVLNALEEQNAEHNNGLPRVALKMATGTGKTVVMAMVIAWQTINKVFAPHDSRFARRFVVVTPGLTIRDRLRVLLPEEPTNYYRERDLVPAEYLTDLGQAKIVITNFHAFKLRESIAVNANTKLLVSGKDGASPFLESPARMVTRVCRELGGTSEIVVLNDEAHHCYRGRVADPDTEADTVATLKGEQRKEAKDREEQARVWFAGLEAVRDKLGIKRVYDLSATPFFLAGSGYREGTLFPWVVSDFSLIDAIESGIVKIPRVPVDDDRVSPDVTYLNLWEKIRDELPKTGRRGGGNAQFGADDLPQALQSALHSLYGSYEKAFRAWESSHARLEGQPPPVFIVVCSNTAVSKAVYDWIGGWERTTGDTNVLLPGRLELLSNVADGQRLHRQPTILVDAAELESGSLSPEFRRAVEHEIAEFAHEYARRFPGRSAQDIGDAELLREVMNTVGKPGKLGEHVRCVVSVSMLTEGWDANTVTHIVGVRAFGTQLLCEQVVGRGLRRRSYVVDEDTGMFTPEYADVYGVPFQFIPTVAATRDLTMKPTRHVRAEPDRSAKLEITFPRVVGYHVEMPDAPLIADFDGPEKRIVLSKADLPTETTVAGLIGDSEIHNLETLRATREQKIVYSLAAKVLETHFRTAEGDRRPWYFPQLLAIVRDWLGQCVVLHDDAFLGMLLLRQQEAADKIWQSISWLGGSRAKYVLPVLRTSDPMGSTSIVDFRTTRDVYETRPDRCPVNFVTLDGAGGNAWERAVAQALETMPEVASYVKNDHLDFAIPYEHDGRSRRFYPDFLVRLADRADGVTRTLIVEVSGGRKPAAQAAQKAAAARQMWAPAINNHGGFGRWSFCELRDPTRTKLDLAPAIEALYAERGVSAFTDLIDDMQEAGR